MIEGHLEGILAHWTLGLTTAFMEGLKQAFLAHKAKGPRVQDGGMYDRHCLLRRRETHPIVLLMTH